MQCFQNQPVIELEKLPVHGSLVGSTVEVELVMS